MIDDVTFRQSHEARKTKRSGVTLVAFYGDTKPSNLLDLITLTQDGLSQCLSDYPNLVHLYQYWSHATLCGIEGYRDSNGTIHTENMRNRAKNTDEPNRPFAIDGFLNFVRTYPWPMRFQFGGYYPDEINSNDPQRKPWERSFAVRSDALAVLMGWPLDAIERPFPPTLYNFRKALHPYGIVHKYHCAPEGVDNDLFMITAELNYDEWEHLAPKERQKIRRRLEYFQKNIRTTLQTKRFVIHLNLNQIWLIKYHRTSLKEVEFAKKIAEVSVDDIYGLYNAYDST